MVSHIAVSQKILNCKTLFSNRGKNSRTKPNCPGHRQFQVTYEHEPCPCTHCTQSQDKSFLLSQKDW